MDIRLFQRGEFVLSLDLHPSCHQVFQLMCQYANAALRETKYVDVCIHVQDYLTDRIFVSKGGNAFWVRSLRI